jgi:hypothetical protein
MVRGHRRQPRIQASIIGGYLVFGQLGDEDPAQRS